MASKTLFILFLVAFSSIIDDAQADWKFWKKKSTTTTVAPPAAGGASGVPGATNQGPVPGVQPNSNPSNPNVNSAIANAANPSLAVGINNAGPGNTAPVNPNLQDRSGPRAPNPGTDVGLDIARPKPNPPGVNKPGQNYRDWAADLTGAGEPGRQSPKLPNTGPALSPGHSPQPIPAGNRPGSPVPQGRPGSGVTPERAPSSGPVPAPNTPTTSTTLKPGQRANDPVNPAYPAQNGQRPPGSLTPTPVRGQPLPGLAPTPVSPGGKSWAEVAGGGGGSRSPSPTAAPRPHPSGGSPVPSRSGTGAIAAGAGAAAAGVAGAALAGGQKKVYSGNPTFSKGNTVTDEDLEKLSEALFIKDSNNAFKHIRLNLQKQTSSSNSKDEASEPLLTVNSAAHQIPTIQKVLALYDNYQLDTKTNEYISPAQRQEESLLVDTFLSTNVMSFAMRFLADKGFVRKDYYDYKDTLRRMWFDLYSRGEGKIGSAGFEHVFLTEVKLQTEVSGLHNWIYFNAEEVKKRADYLGYIKKVDLGENAAILKLHIKFNGIDKPVTTMFIGTSPELEMALYTVCFLTRPDSSCPVSLGGTKFNILTHKFKYRGKELVGSAYPDI